MSGINSESSLRLAILELEGQQKEDGIHVRAAVNQVRESVKPINLIKNSLQLLNEPADLKEHTLQTTLVLGIGILAKRIVIGSSSNPVKRLVGVAVQIGISNLLTQNPDVLNALGGVWSRLTSKKGKRSEKE